MTVSADDEAFFRQYSIALRMWCRRFNTADIAAHLGIAEPVVCRWIWHWRELSRGGAVMPLASVSACHVAAMSSRVVFACGARCARYPTFPQVQLNS